MYLALSGAYVLSRSVRWKVRGWYVSCDSGGTPVAVNESVRCKGPGLGPDAGSDGVTKKLMISI